jgi:sigma-B regulation protein RsbQ
MTVDIYKRNNIKIQGNLRSGKTIVFGHGFGTDQSAWDQIKSSFTQDYNVVLFDNTGEGGSDLDAYDPEKYQTLEGYADDLVEICKELHIKDAVFVGHSVSGMVGLLASLNEPGIFSKMVLIGASPRYLNDQNYTGGFTQSDLDSLYLSMRMSYLEWVRGFSRSAMANEDKPDLRRQFAQSLLSLRPDIALAVAKCIFQSDFRLILKWVESEVLILQAKKDIAVPAEVANYLQSKIKRSKTVFVDAEGHFPHISAPKEVVKAMRGFL